MVAWLNGKKTYICAALAAIAALVEFVAKGDFSMTADLAFVNSAAIAAAIAAFRSAFAKTTPAA
jgi:GTP:adenosylcobinamide-phosphate guanylyltransferase